jgi:hypothetical protein
MTWCHLLHNKEKVLWAEDATGTKPEQFYSWVICQGKESGFMSSAYHKFFLQNVTV